MCFKKKIKQDNRKIRDCNCSDMKWKTTKWFNSRMLLLATDQPCSEFTVLVYKLVLLYYYLMFNIKSCGLSTCQLFNGILYIWKVLVCGNTRKNLEPKPHKVQVMRNHSLEGVNFLQLKLTETDHYSSPNLHVWEGNPYRHGKIMQCVVKIMLYFLGFLAKQCHLVQIIEKLETAFNWYTSNYLIPVYCWHNPEILQLRAQQVSWTCKNQKCIYR